VTVDACLSDEQLFFYSEGLLDEEETRSVAAHLKSCDLCAARYLAEVEFTVALRELPAPEPSTAMSKHVVKKIRGARAVGRTSVWWWVVALGLLVASGARWLVVGELSPVKAVVAIGDFTWDGAIGAVRMATLLGDLETWRHLGRASVSVLETASSSPVWLASSITAAVMVAVATNVVLWTVARRALAGR
jgi:anti-sigma factor RsiW